MQPFSFSVATLVSSNDRTDFNITDFYNIVADSRNVRSLDPEIVLIDIADASRDEIADLVGALPAFSPKAVGLDITFVEKRPGDSYLIDAIRSNPNVTMVTNLVPDRTVNASAFVIDGGSYFADSLPDAAFGASNLPTRIPGGVVRQFVTFYPSADSASAPVPSFPVAMAATVDTAAVSALNARGKHLENINYPS
ncbi:MAG: CHASE2 domain-containing protein, partial [Muribaculaceae bacterium]|nr:CHASE2 domain-containing protein [Muribaculaceae bacterium]